MKYTIDSLENSHLWY